MIEPCPFVSVVVPIRNEARYIARSLSGILAQNYPADRMEVIVADGQSDDGTREIVEDFCARDTRVRLLDNPRRIVATGLNAALRCARGDVFVRVDGHCVIDPDYVPRAVSYLSAQVAAVGGPLTTVGETSTAIAIAAAMSSRFGVGDSLFRVGSDRPRLTDTVAFPAYSREALRRAGPFDEELVRNQDDEYSYRLRAMGYDVLLAPDVRARYYSRGTLRSLWRQYFQYGYWKVRVLQKHPKQMRVRQFVPAAFLAALALGVAATAAIPGGWIVLAAIGVPYVAAATCATLVVARRTGWRVLPILPLSFAALHLSYGLGMFVGLARFASRWADRRSPDTAIQQAWL